MATTAPSPIRTGMLGILTLGRSLVDDSRPTERRGASLRGTTRDRTLLMRGFLLPLAERAPGL